MPRTSCTAGLLLSLTCCAPLSAGDWAQWRGPARDGRVPAGEAVPATLPSPPRVVWHVKVGFGLASPVVSGGRVFYLDDQAGKEIVHGADAASGRELWSAELDESHKDDESRPGPRCTPLADGDRLYAQSTRGELRCLGAADGKVIWRTGYVKDFGAIYIGEIGAAMGASRHGYTGSPVIVGNHLIAEVGGVHGASVVCFDKLDGKVVWKSQDDVPGYAAPVIATIAGTRQVVAFMSERVMGLDAADGKILWQTPVKTSFARHVTTPLVVGNIVIVSSHQAGLIGIRIARDGPAFAADRAWTNKQSAINFSSPVAVGDHLYGVGPMKNLICVDARTGQQAWTTDGYFATTNAGNTHAGAIVMGPNILFLTDGGGLVLVAGDEKEFRQISRVQVCGHNWCEPAYADGKLFLRDDRELSCVQLLP